MTQMMKKKRKTRLKSIILKFCDPNDPNFDLFKNLGEINLHISKLREENAENKGNNKAINKIVKEFQKIVAVKN